MLAAVVVAAAVLAATTCLPGNAVAGGFAYLQMPARGGIALPGSPYRWTTIATRRGDRVTVVAQVDRRDGTVHRWWSVPGAWHLSAPAYDGDGTGLAGDESVLALARYERAPHGLRPSTHLAILDTGHHRRDGSGAVRHLTLHGDYGVYAISPDGATLYLVHTLAFGPRGIRFEIQPYDLRARRLLPAAAIRGNGRVLRGVATERREDAGGDRVYTLYGDEDGGSAAITLLALDTVRGRLTRVELPRRRGPVGAFSHVVGHSRGGRPIELLEVGDLSLPGRMLVFGCIHGDECGASDLEPLENGCPDPDVHAYVVPNLDPDGSAARSRLNAHGVDLNRNFPSGWRPIGAPGDPEYAGPRPFSEPEARLAARLVRRLHPRLTIWFHQHWGRGSYARAWGQSVPAARRFARLAAIGFRPLRWPAGTGPNWQNHRFPGAASFVVETPRGKLGEPLRERLTHALSQLGEQVGEDPGVPRKG